MKTVFCFFAVAVLLCGCYAARFNDAMFKARKDFLFKNRAPRDGTQVIKTKPFPCSFGFKYEYIDDNLSYKGEYKRYNFSEIDVCQKYNNIHTFVKRADIRYPSYSATYDVYYASAVEGDGSCSASAAPLDIKYTVSFAFQYFGETVLYCDEVNETTRDGEKCTICTSGSVSYFIKDDRVIGVYDYEYEFTMKIEELKFDDFREDIVLPKNCQDSSIPEGFYSAPAEVDECKTKLKSIDLKKLPCTFGVNYSMYGISGQYKKYGKSSLDVYMRGNTAVTTLIRADIHEPGYPETALWVKAESTDDNCELYRPNFVNPDEQWFSTVEEIFRLNGAYDGKVYCYSVDDTTFDEKKCKSCVSPFPDGGTLFVEDGLIIGAEMSTYTAHMGYMFEDFREDFSFTCSDTSYDLPEEVHTVPPEEKDCDCKPKDEGSASSIGVAASMIICMAMITLISLF